MSHPIRHQRLSKLFAPVLLMSGLLLILFPPATAPAAEKRRSVDLSTAIIQVAKQTIPAVVHIEVTERKEVANPFLPFENDPFFRRFFNIPEMPKKFKRETKGLGTGMIIDPQGHILTNHHVAGGATKLEVLLSNGQKYQAKLIGTDPKTDLAVIKISVKERLPYVKFGDSDKAEVGEWVVAIGHPRGLDQTVTQGIISAKHRQGIADPGSYQDFLQTDAAINPGNSGGPLLNLHGEVIGVNAVIVSESGGSEGIGFTIPSNMATQVAKALIAHGKVERGWLGVSIQDLTPELAKTIQITATKGAFVAEVIKGSPAEIGGLMKNDVITAFAGKTISDSSSLRNSVAAAPVGQEVKVVVLRSRKKLELNVKIGNLESSSQVLAETVKERLGVGVRALTAREAEKYGLDERKGVAVSWVDSQGALGKEGFEVGDVILEIEKQPVDGVNGFIDLASMLKSGEEITVLVLDHRTGNVQSIQATVK